jgi:hypothetical protein
MDKYFLFLNLAFTPVVEAGVKIDKITEAY